MAKRFDFSKPEEVIQEIKCAEPRSAILVGASLLEYTLEQAIRAQLRKAKTATEAEYLFDDQRGVFSGFERKIWAAYFLNVVGPQTRGDLDIVRRMRNYCAHNVKRVSFELTPISGQCRSFSMLKRPSARVEEKDRIKWRDTHLSVVLSEMKDEPPSLRTNFITVVNALATCLMLKALLPPGILEEATAAQQVTVKNIFRRFVDP